MNELKRRLEAGDPLLGGAAMSPADRERMRRLVLAVPAVAPTPAWSGVVTALACSLAVAVGASVWTVRNAVLDKQGAVAQARVSELAVEATGRRQVQFSTPGGTRVIWVLETRSN